MEERWARMTPEERESSCGDARAVGMRVWARPRACGGTEAGGLMRLQEKDGGMTPDGIEPFGDEEIGATLHAVSGQRRKGR